MRNFCSNLDLEYKFGIHERESPHHGAVLEWKMIPGQWVLGGLLGGPPINWSVWKIGESHGLGPIPTLRQRLNDVLNLITSYNCLQNVFWGSLNQLLFFVDFIPMFIRNVCCRYVGDSKIQMFFVGHVDNPLVFTWSKVKISPWQKNSDDKFL